MKQMDTILIVDDIISNLIYLRAILENEGYGVWEAVNGQEALELLENNKPDLILLDMMMPIMDGLEFCKRAKQDKELKEIPIIIISAVSETNDKVQAIQLGAVDYVTKPFQQEELLGRIKTHVSLKEKEKKLQEANKMLEEYKDNLETIVKERTNELEASNKKLTKTNDELKKQKKQLEKTLKKLNQTQARLIHSEKMASLGVLVAGVAHEINNPVNYVNSSMMGLKNNLEILKNYSHKHIQPVENNGGSNETDNEISFDQLTDMLIRATELIEVGIDRTKKIVKSLKSFTRSDQNKMEAFNIKANIENTLIILHSYYKDRIEIIKDYGEVPMIECFPGKINQVLLNLLINAMQAIKGKGKIWISTGAKSENKIYIKIKDTGVGIEEKELKHIFDTFFTTKTRENGSGLGLSISESIMKEHKGEIIVESMVGVGTEFTLILPVKQKK